MSIDSTSVKVHQDGTGAPTKGGAPCSSQGQAGDRTLAQPVPGLTGERSDDEAARHRAGRPPPADHDPDAGPLERRALGTLAAGAARSHIWSAATARRPRLRGRRDARAGCRTRLGVSHAAKVESPQALGAEPRRLSRPQRDRTLLRSHQTTARDRHSLPQTRPCLSQPSPPRLHPLHDETE